MVELGTNRDEQPIARERGLPTTQDNRPLPLLPPKAAFQLAAHPATFYADVEAGRLLPYLTPISQNPGVNGATEARPNQGIKNLADEGFLPVPTNAVPDDGHYLQAVDVPGGTHWCTRWVKPIVGSRRTRFDAAGYREWLCWLVDTKVLQLPEEHHIEHGLRRGEKALHSAEERAVQSPAAAREAERYRAEVAIWRTALEPESNPAPKRRTRAKKPAAQES